MTAADPRPPLPPCACLAAPSAALVLDRELGMDARFASLTLLACPACDRRWLRYHYEVEAFTASGRWYLGLLSPEQAAGLTAADAQSALESLDWYFYGGSYFGGRIGKTAGPLNLTP